MTAADRAARTEAADELCRGVFEKALEGAEPVGASLVAVGGYGRRELAPHSDLDVLLLHDPGLDVTELAERVLYPLWDAGVRLDHSVRTAEDVTRAAAADARVALGLLDARHLAGDPNLSLRLRADVLATWRREARATLPRLRSLVEERHARTGELAHAAIPDLKESAGGLRDATVLTALVATWLVDVPHVDLERCRRQLLDLRDVLHEAAGRPTDRVTPELWSALAPATPPDAPADPGASPEETAQRHLRRIGRRTAHLSRLTWSRVDQVLAPAPVGPRRPRLEPVAPGIAVARGEVVLTRGADPAGDPLLLLRAAAVAAERGLMLAPATAARLAAESAPPPAPWPRPARDLWVRLLAAGPGLLAVWETLDETGALDLLLPEWEQVRLLPHASVVHRFTVDRHLVETCVEASRLIRRVARPDLLLVGALLHDIGKASRVDHSIAGEPVAAAAAVRLGFTPPEAATVAALVRWHLLLSSTAASRDLEDPATIRSVAERVGSVERLELLRVLTEADARATAPKAWTTWRATLVEELVDRVRRALSSGHLPEPAESEPPLTSREEQAALADPAYLHLDVEPGPEGSRVRVVAHDRPGLMADVSGALVALRAPVQAARAWTSDALAVSVWDVADVALDQAVLGQRLAAVAAGTLDPAARLRPGATDPLAPSVLIHHEEAADATVLEVRTEDRPGVLHLVCRALAALDLTVRSAHVDTFGPQSLDVLYVQEAGAGALSDARAAAAAHAIRDALTGAATLDA